MSKQPDTLSVWNALGRTDPDQTKKFTRAGGFKGTAVKPIYMDQKMTERFGPCGVGWGITEPHYQLVNGPDGEVAVYCWLSVWFKDDDTASEPIPGVGGDFVVKKTKYGLASDDEAFKKAATDAIGNAMKHLGMAADVHMGQHDDDKYVTELRRELHENGPRGRANESGHQSEKPGAKDTPAAKDKGADSLGDHITVIDLDGQPQDFPRTNKGALQAMKALEDEIDRVDDVQAKAKVWENNAKVFQALAKTKAGGFREQDGAQTIAERVQLCEQAFDQYLKQHAA